MSLINEALKKAQQAQSPQEDPSPPPPVAMDKGYTPPPSASSSGGGHGNLVKALIAGMVLMAVFVGAGVFLVVLFLKSGGSEETVPQAPVTEAPAPVVEVKPVEPAPQPVQPVVQSAPVAPAKAAEADTILGKVGQVATAAEASREEMDEIVEAVSAPPPEPKPVVAQPAPVQPKPAVSQQAPVAAATPQPAPVQAPQPAYNPQSLPPLEAPAPAAPVSNPAITDWVEKVEVQGIKLAGSNSKVLMDNKVFRINSVVNRDLGIKVKEIKKSEIVFTDNVGVIYTKFF